MYAVIKTGGKQYRVAPGDVLKIATLNEEVGASVNFEEVLMIADGDNVTVGTPTIASAKVAATVIAHGRAKKVEIIKFRRRKHHQKRTGHRQNFTQVQIQNINGEGAPERVATPKTAEVLAALAAGTAAAATAAKAKSTASKATPKKKAAAKPAAKKEAPKAEATEKKAAAPKATAEKKPAAKKAAPKKAASKAKGGDDLTKIEGVGPKAAGALADAGLATFAAVSKASEAEIQKILDESEGRFGMMKPATWPKQAELAADGKWDELKKWQDEMDGGIE